MKDAKTFLDTWMLPLALTTGITVYLLFRFVPFMMPSEPAISAFAKEFQPIAVACMLFLQYNKVSPHDIKIQKWHIWLLALQAIGFVLLALITSGMEEGIWKILMECATLCIICPTAAAAGVITDKLGGSLSHTISYTVLSNCLAAIMIPLLIPVINSTDGATFGYSFLKICKRVFPLLIFPLLLAWFIRYCIKPLQHFLMRYTFLAFYLWGISLTFAMFLATRALLNSGVSVPGAMLIGIVSFACTLFQFYAGRKAGKPYGKIESVTAGQALGQKNTGFLIWLGYSFLTPVTSVSGGLYAIFQNLFNSWELHEHDEEIEAKGPRA